MENLYVDKPYFHLDLAPDGNFQLAQADMLADVINDLEIMLTAAMQEKDPERKVRGLMSALVCSHKRA